MHSVFLVKSGVTGSGGPRRGGVLRDREEGARRRAVPMSPATSFTQGARSSTPGRRRDPLVLGPWLPRAPRHAHDSLRRGELDAWLPTSFARAAASFTRAWGARYLATGELCLSCCELGLWPPQAPRRGPDTGSSTPDCIGGPQQAAPRALAEKLVPATPVHGSSLSIEKEE
jgi:hypothetical protein